MERIIIKSQTFVLIFKKKPTDKQQKPNQRKTQTKTNKQTNQNPQTNKWNLILLLDHEELNYFRLWYKKVTMKCMQSETSG